jgi:hypothetical protein
MKVDRGKLEELLIANWTRFIDPRQMRATLQEVVNEHRHELVPLPSLERTQTQMTISRFQPGSAGFTVWVDFTNLPLPDGESFTTGTSEFHLAWDGNLNHIRTLGGLFLKN